MALAALICTGLRGCYFAGWEYISTGWWWATLMRHCLLARPPLPLAPGVGVAALAAVLVAFGSGALGATSGLVRAGRAAVALAAVAVAADEHSAATQGAQKASGRWWRRGLGGGHGRSIPMRGPTLLDSHARFVNTDSGNGALQSGGSRGATVGLPESDCHCRACFLHR